MKGVQNSYRSIPFKFTAEMVDRWHSCQTPATGFWLVVIEILSVFTLWGGPQVSCSPIPISENTAWFKKMYSISSSGFFLKLVKIQKTLFSNRTELHPIGTGCSTFSEWISTATMDRSRRERRPGASVLAPEISWSHTLRLFLVGVRKRSSLCTISTNNFGRPKQPYHNCGELCDTTHSSSGVERIQLPSRCYPCGRRGAHWTFINFIMSTIKCNLHHICH